MEQYHNTSHLHKHQNLSPACIDYSGINLPTATRDVNNYSEIPVQEEYDTTEPLKSKKKIGRNNIVPEYYSTLESSSREAYNTVDHSKNINKRQPYRGAAIPPDFNSYSHIKPPTEHYESTSHKMSKKRRVNNLMHPQHEPITTYSQLQPLPNDSLH